MFNYFYYAHFGKRLNGLYGVFSLLILMRSKIKLMNRIDGYLRWQDQRYFLIEKYLISLFDFILFYFFVLLL